MAKGFSLIELLVSAGILIAMTTISLPFIRQYQPNFRLDGASRDLATDLRLSQQLSIAEQIVYYLAISTSTRQYQLYRTGSTTPFKTYTLPNDISFDSVSGLTGDTVYFNAYGAVSESGTIKLQNNQGKIKVINIKPSGYVELQQ